MIEVGLIQSKTPNPLLVSTQSVELSSTSLTLHKEGSIDPQIYFVALMH